MCLPLLLSTLTQLFRDVKGFSDFFCKSPHFESKKTNETLGQQ